MSKVYSFRLDNNNPREIQAREVIEPWISKGYSLRFALTKVLIQSDNQKDPKTMESILAQVSNLIKQIENKSASNRAANTVAISLQASFIQSVKKSMKVGLTEPKKCIINFSFIAEGSYFRINL